MLWEERLGDPLTDFAPPGLGIRVLTNWDAGVEIVAPFDEAGTVGPGVRRFLDERGEGVYAVVVDVEDLEQATAEMVAAGAPCRTPRTSSSVTGPPPAVHEVHAGRPARHAPDAAAHRSRPRAGAVGAPRVVPGAGEDGALRF